MQAESSEAPAESEERSTIELVVPVRSELMVLVRLSAATLASQAGFGIEEIDDLRLAVDELCVSLISGEVRGPMRLCFVVEPGAIEITSSVSGVAAADPDAEDRDEAVWSKRILDALVDEHGSDASGGERHAWLRKRVTH